VIRDLRGGQRAIVSSLSSASGQSEGTRSRCRHRMLYPALLCAQYARRCCNRGTIRANILVTWRFSRFRSFSRAFVSVRHSPRYLQLHTIMAKTSTSPSSTTGIVSDFLAKYQKTTPKKIKLIDGFLAYVLATGITQFIYCALVGTFPFNSFLSGFVCTVGVFVLAGTTCISAIHGLVLYTRSAANMPCVSSVAPHADQPGERFPRPNGAACVCGLPVLQHHSFPRGVQLHGLSYGSACAVESTIQTNPVRGGPDHHETDLARRGSSWEDSSGRGMNVHVALFLNRLMGQRTLTAVCRETTII
jgi:hypothetical protein